MSLLSHARSPLLVWRTISRSVGRLKRLWPERVQRDKRERLHHIARVEHWRVRCLLCFRRLWKLREATHPKAARLPVLWAAGSTDAAALGSPGKTRIAAGSRKYR